MKMKGLFYYTGLSLRRGKLRLGIRQRGLARRLRSHPATLAMVMLGCAFLAGGSVPAAAQAIAVPAASKPAQAAGEGGSSLESAASRAGEMGRKVAMSLIGLALALAAIVLAFRRNFREAVGVLAVGIVAVLLATPAGVSLLQNTVKSLFGSA